MRQILVSLAAVVALTVSASLAAPTAGVPAPNLMDRDSAAPHGDTVWVVNRDADSLTVFEAATGQRS